MLKTYTRKKTRLILGVGINDADYPVCKTENRRIVWTCPYYKTWRNMLDRCYCAAYQRRQPTYVGCTVAPEWLSFMTFRFWMGRQDWEGNHLDKDTLSYGNKLYGPETCCFVPRVLNNLFLDHAAARGAYPQGVSFNKRRRKYEASINRYGKKKGLGYFTTAKEASRIYLQAKFTYVSEMANATSDPRVAAALRKHAARIQTAAETAAPTSETA